MGNYRNFKLVVYFVAGGVKRATREQLEKDLAFFARHMRLDKVYLEPYRDFFAGEEQVKMCKAVFQEHDIEVSGGITTTFLAADDPEGKQRMFDTLCYNDERMTSRLRKVSQFLGEHFDEFIIDDFYFTNCTCDRCRAGRDTYNKAHGITDGSWQAYRLDLMYRVSQEYMIAPAKTANPGCSITIKYPNWAESYQETGYNPEGQRRIFDNLYTGTETRDPVTTDQHLPRYLSYSLMTYFENMWPGHNGGGWFDPFDMHITEHYLEQAYLTAFSKPKELMMFCFQALANTMNVPALGFQLDRLDAVLDHCGAPVGLPCYLPDHCQGEDNVQDFLGMVGLPIVCTPYFPSESPALLLTRSSACDPEVVDKLEQYVAKGGRALVTHGFVQATMERGIKRITSIRFADRKVMAEDFLVEQVPSKMHWRLMTYPHGPKPILITVPEHRNNASWALIKTRVGQESYGMLLRDTYGRGEMLTLTVPESFSDLYHLPVDVLTRLRAAFPVNGVHLECGAQISLFVYDNDAFIVYPYVDDGTQPSLVRIHVAGQVQRLDMPVEGKSLQPLFTTDTETVFEYRAVPGQYTLYQIVR
ncbi:MAG: permease [Clostridia bacterium]|nr:permease [Clostridia bacterium]